MRQAAKENGPMARTVGEQIKTGFLLAGAFLSFCASLFLLAYGLDAVWSDGHFVSSAWLGWVELSLAAVLIPLTMTSVDPVFRGMLCVSASSRVFWSLLLAEIGFLLTWPSPGRRQQRWPFSSVPRSSGWQGLLRPDRIFRIGLPSPCTCFFYCGRLTTLIFPSHGQEWA